MEDDYRIFNLKGLKIWIIILSFEKRVQKAFYFLLI